MEDQLVADARRFALARHKGQTYPPTGGIVPFEYHLANVVGVLQRYGHGNDTLLVASAWLHDTLEDTDATFVEIEEMSPGVARVVYAVTDEPGATRIERKRKTYPKIVEVGDPAVTVKVADRIANVESSLLAREVGLWPKFIREYVAEHDEFHALLRPAGGDEVMWDHLNELIAKAREWLKS